jgi:transposase-like protein
MTKTEVKPAISAVKDLMAEEPDALREIVRSVMQAMLEAEMDEARWATVFPFSSRSSSSAGNYVMGRMFCRPLVSSNSAI